MLNLFYSGGRIAFQNFNRAFEKINNKYFRSTLTQNLLNFKSEKQFILLKFYEYCSNYKTKGFLK